MPTAFARPTAVTALRIDRCPAARFGMSRPYPGPRGERAVAARGPVRTPGSRVRPAAPRGRSRAVSAP